MFGEGKRDKDFLISLQHLEKFQYYTQLWHLNYDNASGGSAKIVLEKCHKAMANTEYDLVLCFVDLDVLIMDHPVTWKKEKEKLEEKYNRIKIIWQYNNAEEEYKRVIGEMKGKKTIYKEAKRQIEKFINSEFWKRILEPIKEQEAILERRKNED